MAPLRPEGTRRGLTALFLVPLLIVGMVSFVYIRAHQNTGADLLVRQQHIRALTAAGVERVVGEAPDPVTNAPGVRARCAPAGSGPLSNPWRCVIAYRSGRQIQYQVTLSATGSYTGDHEIVDYRGLRHRDTGSIRGCCIAVP